jgi:hypothetical protein
MKKAYTTKKVFDCQQMPEDVRDAFFKATDGTGNDCYVGWGWHQESVNAWLIENGAKKNEDILISHWW